MAVIAVIILALYGVGKFFTDNPDQPVSTVDYEQTIAQAQPSTEVGLLAPDPLPAGWRATSARFARSDTGGSWHLGILTAADEYVGVEQTPLSTSSAIERWAADSEDAGSAEVAGKVWQVRAGPGDRIAYVTREGARTTLVNGTVSQPELEDYISSLSSTD